MALLSILLCYIVSYRMALYYIVSYCRKLYSIARCCSELHSIVLNCIVFLYMNMCVNVYVQVYVYIHNYVCILTQRRLDQSQPTPTRTNPNQRRPKPTDFISTKLGDCYQCNSTQISIVRAWTYTFFEPTHLAYMPGRGAPHVCFQNYSCRSAFFAVFPKRP